MCRFQFAGVPFGSCSFSSRCLLFCRKACSLLNCNFNRCFLFQRQNARMWNQQPHCGSKMPSFEKWWIFWFGHRPVKLCRDGWGLQVLPRKVIIFSECRTKTSMGSKQVRWFDLFHQTGGVRPTNRAKQKVYITSALFKHHFWWSKKCFCNANRSLEWKCVFSTEQHHVCETTHFQVLLNPALGLRELARHQLEAAWNVLDVVDCIKDALLNNVIFFKIERSGFAALKALGDQFCSLWLDLGSPQRADFGMFGKTLFLVNQRITHVIQKTTPKSIPKSGKPLENP